MAENKSKEGTNIPDELEKKIEEANIYLNGIKEESKKALEGKTKLEDDILVLFKEKKDAEDYLKQVEVKIDKSEGTLSSINFGIRSATENLDVINKKIVNASEELEGLELQKEEVINRDNKSKERETLSLEKEKKLDEGIKKIKEILELLK